MKNTLKILLAGIGVLTLSPCSYSQNSINQKLVNRYPYVIHADWRPENVASSNKCDIALLGSDIHETEQNLKRMLKPEYLPSRDDLKNIVGIKDYMADNKRLTELIRSNDYLILKYETKTHIPMMIQDGFFLNVLVENQIGSSSDDSDPTNVVVAAAVNMLNYPAGVDLLAKLKICHINTFGKSKVGNLCWERSNSSGRDWYCNIEWWSDGNRVLFVLPKWTKDDYKTWHKMMCAGCARKFIFRGKFSAMPREVVSDAVSKQQQCVRNLRLIEAYKETWELEKRMTNGAPVVASEVNAYDKLKMPPICPAGGVYVYNPVGINPVCSFVVTNNEGRIIRHRLKD
jgi:hypothetical protein